MAYTVGVIGAGQLARMMIAPALELGIDLSVFAEAESMSAAIAASVVGDFRDGMAVANFAEGVDVITFDHEHVPLEILHALVANGSKVHPTPEALLFAQDKLAMRARLGGLGLPMPSWAGVGSVAELTAFIEAHGGRAIVKTPRGGYDGKGVRVVADAQDVAPWFDDGPVLAEELVEFRRELSQLLARRPSGDIALWPVVESIQKDGVCAEVIAPAPGASRLLKDTAASIATAVAENLGVTGVLAVELFETTDDRVLINELAMRPHNSGHWTMDGAVTSQFEQHLRAVLDLPLGSTAPRDRWSVMVNVLGGPASGTVLDRYPSALADQPAVKFHEYGKESRQGRKVGHVTAGGDDLDDVIARARAASLALTD